MAIARRGILFCVVGPAGSGKSTLAEWLLSQPEVRLKKTVSVTTRAARSGEVPNVSYIFISKDEFLRKKSTGYFFESEEVHGNFYGTPKEQLESALQTGQDLMLVIDIRGAINLKKSYRHDTCIVFVVPPSPQVLLERLRARGSGDEAEFKRRIETAKAEYDEVRRSANDQPSLIDYILVNDDLGRSRTELQHILESERLRLARLNKGQLEKICVV